MTAELKILAAAASVNDEHWCIPSSSTPIERPAAFDKLTQSALHAAALVLQNVPETARGNMALIVGTTLGSLETDRVFDRSRREACGRYASPAAFSRTLPSTIPAEIALRFGIKGPSLILCAGNNSAALALDRAVSWMRHLNLDYCLAGALDCVTPPLAEKESCFAAFLLLAKSGTPIATLGIDPPTQINLTAAHDTSLLNFINCIRSSHPPTMGNIRLIRADQ